MSCGADNRLPMIHSFHTGTPLARGLRDLLAKLADRMGLSNDIKVFIAGGMAVHLYTAARTTTDLDAEFSACVHLPSDIVVEVLNDDGTSQLVYLDSNYNSTLSLMHEDYQIDSIPINLNVEHFDVRLLSPVDLAVSKISRLAENDCEDIRSLVSKGLTTADEIEERAHAAMGGYVGSLTTLKQNLNDALKIARQAELDQSLSAGASGADSTSRADDDLGNGP